MKKPILIIVLSLLWTLAGSHNSEQTKKKITFLCEKQIFEAEIYSKDFSIELFKQALYYAEISNPQIVFSQAILETGNFTSELFVEGKNLFGFRVAKKRPTPAIGEYNYHAKYWHFYDSIRDYKYFQDYWRAKGYNLNNYLTFLTEIKYATDLEYINKLLNIVS